MRTPATAILRDAEDLVLRGERRQQYGDPVDAHERIGQVWSALAGTKITGRQVALMFAAAKLVRTHDEHHADSVLDAAGYVLVANLCAEHEARA